MIIIMKTCTHALSLVAKSNLKTALALGTAILTIASTAMAQVTPISVPDAGVGPLTFSTFPALANGWSTVSIAGAGNTASTATALDALVQTNSVAGIVTALGQSSTVPPSANALFRWNSAAQYIQGRPTGNSHALLLATLRNDGTSDKSQVGISYDFSTASPAATPEQIPGFLVYYSLTGAPGTWQPVGPLSQNETIGNQNTCITLASPWEVGANLYILWVDDNADGITDPSWHIDNFAVNPGLCQPPERPRITAQPTSSTVVQCRNATFTVVAQSSLPMTYQWFHGTTAIPTGTNATLTITSAQSADAGSYYVTVSNSIGATDSDTVSLAVDPDLTPPTIISVLALANGTNYSVNFNDEVLNATTVEASGFRVRPLAGGADILITSAVINRGTNVLLGADTPRAATGNYELVVDPSIEDCAANAIQGGTPDPDGRLAFPMQYEYPLLAINGSQWKYNHEGIDLGLDWRLDPTYDDSTWSNGVSLLDGKNPVRTTLGGFPVNTQLPLMFAPNYPSTDVPVYYFRTHFTLPTPLSGIASVRLRTMVDDFDAAYLNNIDTIAHQRMTPFPTNVDGYTYSGGTAVGDGAPEGPFNIDKALLVEGQNLIAAKLFQVNETSSDITFAYELIAVVNSFAAARPSLSIVNNGNGTVTITSSGGGTLYQADTVDTPASGWTVVAGQSNGSATVASGTSAKFYTLRQ